MIHLMITNPFTKQAQRQFSGRIVFLTNDARTIGSACTQTLNFNPYHSLFTKHNLKWNIDLDEKLT